MSFVYPNTPPSDQGSGDAPFVQRIEVAVPAQTIAADGTTVVGEVEIVASSGLGVAGTPTPLPATVTSCAFVPTAAMTGDNTNARTYTLVNKGSAGTGTTVVATLALTTGVNLVAFTENEFTLSVVANATQVNSGDILAFVSTHTGTGVVDPGGRAIIEVTRAA